METLALNSMVCPVCKDEYKGCEFCKFKGIVYYVFESGYYTIMKAAAEFKQMLKETV